LCPPLSPPRRDWTSRVDEHMLRAVMILVFYAASGHEHIAVLTCRKPCHAIISGVVLEAPSLANGEPLNHTEYTQTRLIFYPDGVASQSQLWLSDVMECVQSGRQTLSWSWIKTQHIFNCTASDRDQVSVIRGKELEGRQQQWHWWIIRLSCHRQHGAGGLITILNFIISLQQLAKTMFTRCLTG